MWSGPFRFFNVVSNLVLACLLVLSFASANNSAAMLFEILKTFLVTA